MVESISKRINYRTSTGKGRGRRSIDEGYYDFFLEGIKESIVDRRGR